MPCILSLETATKTCSCALTENGNLIASIEFHIDQSHSTVLHPSIEHLMKATGKTMKAIDAVAVSKGPGSYTGLRIGVSTAKGICASLNIPLIAVDTLLAQANKTVNWNFNQYKVVSWIDARRSEVYSAIYTHDLYVIQEPEACVITKDYIMELVQNEPMLFLGNGADKFETWFNEISNAIWVPNQKLSAVEVGFIAGVKWENRQFEDLALFDPFYLKKFKAGVTQKTKV